jgi:iron(III) transport system permease protein
VPDVSLLSPVAISRWTHWDRAAIAAAVLVLLPVAALVHTALFGGGEALQLSAAAWQALTETTLLLAGVAVFTAFVGVGAAWLVSQFQFPGRTLLSFALILPFAVPTYISAYAYVEMFDYFGPVQSWLRGVAGFRSRAEYWFPEMRSMPGAVLVTGLVLYPYVYVACRAAFAVQGAQLNDAARQLGASRAQALLEVILPVIWPALAAGLTLVVFEVLNDIGATQYLGIQTLTVAVYSTWLNKGSLAGAAQLALLMLALVLLLLWAERAVRNNRRYGASARGHRPSTPVRLAGWRAAAAITCCGLPVLMGFGVPGYILVRAGYRQVLEDGVTVELWQALGRSLLAASLATAMVIGAAAMLAVAGRFSRTRATAGALAAAGLGYALPGTVLIIGLMPLLGGFDRLVNDLWIASGGSRIGLILSGSLAAVVIAYVIRFMAIGLDQARAGLVVLSRNADYAAETLGCTQPRLVGGILAPAMRAPLAGAAILVFVDCLKELPATLLLRPLNFETLATLLYGHAARGSFEDGALAGLLIMAAGLLPLLLIGRALDGSVSRSSS